MVSNEKHTFPRMSKLRSMSDTVYSNNDNQELKRAGKRSQSNTCQAIGFEE